MRTRVEELQTPVRRDDDLLTAVDLALQYGITLQRARGLFDKGVIPTTPSGTRRRVTTRRAFLAWRERTHGIRDELQEEPIARPAVEQALNGERHPRPDAGVSADNEVPDIAQMPRVPPREDDDLLSCDDLSRQYNLPRDFARRLIHGGIIRSIPVGERKRVTTRREFRKWQEASLSTPEAEQKGTKRHQGKS